MKKSRLLVGSTHVLAFSLASYDNLPTVPDFKYVCGVLIVLKLMRTASVIFNS